MEIDDENRLVVRRGAKSSVLWLDRMSNDADNCYVVRKGHKVIGYVRHVDPSDPRSLLHPFQEEKWLELARALGQSMAKRHFREAEQRIQESLQRQQPAPVQLSLFDARSTG
jgi:hypothetical protein